MILKTVEKFAGQMDTLQKNWDLAVKNKQT